MPDIVLACFIASWTLVERVRRVTRGSISSEMLMCDGGVRSILLLPLVARCLETIDVCIWHMFVFMSVVVTVWGSVGMFVVWRPLLKMSFEVFIGGPYICYTYEILTSSSHSRIASISSKQLESMYRNGSIIKK